MFKLVVVCLAFVCLSAMQCQAQVNWKNCDDTAVIQVTSLDIPMPMNVQKQSRLKMTALVRENLNTYTNTTFHVVKVMSPIALEVRCYENENGIKVGSCGNIDLCDSFVHLINASPDNCPLSQAQNGIDCRCPINLNAQSTINMDVPIVNYPSNVISQYWFNDELKITINVNGHGKSIMCLSLELSILNSKRRL